MDQEAVTKTETTFEEIYLDDVNHQSLPMVMMVMKKTKWKRRKISWEILWRRLRKRRIALLSQTHLATKVATQKSKEVQ